jgi:hypothetical protein
MTYETEHPKLLAHPPIYVVTSKAQCHECGAIQAVLTFGVTELEDDGDTHGDHKNPSGLLLLSRVTSLPGNVLAYVQSEFPHYQLAHSKTASFSYYANLCKCGANFGDFYLFSEPGGAFFPETPEAARLVDLTQVPIEDVIEIGCSWAEGTPADMILEYGRRVTSSP